MNRREFVKSVAAMAASIPVLAVGAVAPAIALEPKDICPGGAIVTRRLQQTGHLAQKPIPWTKVSVPFERIEGVTKWSRMGDPGKLPRQA